MPTVVLVGERDISDVHAQAGTIEEGIAGTQKDVIINSGHMVQLEQPEILLDKLDAFVELQERNSVDVPVNILQVYAGSYDSPDGTVKIAVDGNHLTLKLPGQSIFPLYAESQSKFFLRTTDIEIEFTRDASGRVKQAEIHQEGSTTKATKL